MHLLVAALFVATFFLGFWQLGKAEAGGGPVNWSYALQWPLYGFMGLWFYPVSYTHLTLPTTPYV